MTLLSLHFIRPDWLWLLPVHFLLCWLALKFSRSTQWHAHLPAAALQVLRVGQSGVKQFDKLWLLVLGICLIVAAAGPSWIKQASPAFNNQKATIILLDLSPSMMSKDVQPDRITRARFELLDILSQHSDGQTGLIAYGGSAHIVSPLTDDASTIKALVPALSPTILPERGSNIEAAVELAERLLEDAGVANGEAILITDGVAAAAKPKVRQALKRISSISILGVGGEKLAPIPEPNGGFMRDTNGEIVLTKLDFGALEELSSSTNGRATKLFADNSDTQVLLNNANSQPNLAGNVMTANDSEKDTTNQYDQWQDMGYLFIILALPIVLMLFRKGAIYSIAVIMLAPMPFDASAQIEFGWQDLFATKDQQASSLMREGKHEEAAATFKNPAWSAVANYKAKQYQDVVDQLADQTDVVSLYNKANALALSGQLQAAVEAYSEVLEKQPENEDAAHNKGFIEKLLEQQSKEDKGDNSQSSDDQQNKDQQESDDGSKQESDDGSKQESADGQDGAQNKQEPSTNNGEPSANNEQPSAGEPSADEQPSGDEQPSPEPTSPEPTSPEPTSQDSSDEQTNDDASNQEDTKSLSEQSAQQSQNDQTAESQTNQQEASNAEERETSQSNKSLDQGQETPQNDEEQSTAEVIAQQAPEGDQASLSDSSEQWLRGINEDPSGLLRRKFEYQAWQRQQQNKQRKQTDTQIRY